MELGRQSGVDWKKLFSQRGFRFFFAGVLVSLCGSGMNFAGVTWYVLGRTNSTVQVSLLLILMTIPGLFVPLFGGVLINRVDRRYLGMTLDVARGLVVAGISALFFLHRAGLGSIYTMVILLGVGSAMYWSNINALVQEVISSGELVAANSAVLIAVQGGIAISGGLVGFIYDRAGIAGILAIDASSYFISAFCLYRLRRGYFAPHVTHRIDLPEPLEAPLAVAEETSMPPLIEPAFESGFISEFREGIQYLRSHPNVLALGITYACMIAGVISANVLVVALTKDILRAGATGYGLMESGWAVGAVAAAFRARSMAQSAATIEALPG
jgi:DHA3 family macrolide efflux protein-like MFS transporter